MLNEPLAAAIAEVTQAVTDRTPGPALALAAALAAEYPADPRMYRLAAHAMLACAELPDGFTALDHAAKDRLYRQLLLQPDCAARPFLLHEQVAARLTSETSGVVPALVRELAPTIAAFLAEGPPAKPLLLFLLVVRGSLGTILPQERLTALHRAAFPDFAERDLALPYSTMFHPRAFGRNRVDLIEALAAEGDAFLARLKPHHLPLLAWLKGGGALFGDGAALFRWLDRSTPPLDATDGQAARAMLLAEGGDGMPGGQARAALAIDDATCMAARRLTEARATLRASVKRAGEAAAARLESRPWMALHAARTLAAGRAPFLARGERRVRLAVCVSGQLRGFRAALPGWHRTLFAHADVTFFVHSWAAVGRGPAQPWRRVLPFANERFGEVYRRLATQEGLAAFEERYPAFYAALGLSGIIAADDLRAAYRTRHVVVEDEGEPRFAGFTNPQKMHYKIWAAQQLVAASGETFDLVVRIRPDLEVRNQAFTWSDMRAACANAPLLFADKALGVHHGVPMIGDQFAIGTGLAMGRYADTWTHYEPLAALDSAGAAPALLGHVSLAQICWVNGIAVRRVPLRFGRLLEPEPFGNDAVLAALSRDAAGRMDAIDRELITAAQPSS